MSEENKDTNAAQTEEAVEVSSVDQLERKMKLRGTIERLELYGAFVDIGLETNALVHISRLGHGRVNRVSDAVNVGDEVEVWVEKVDPEQGQIMVSMVEPLAVDWNDLKEGQVYTGEATRLESFGAFVDIGAEREGLVHISELSHDYVKHPSEVVKVGDQVEVKVIGYNKRKRRIDLSMKALLDKPEKQESASPEDYADLDDGNDEMPTAMEIAMRRAMSKMDSDENGKGGQKGKQRQQKENQEDILQRTLKLRE